MKKVLYYASVDGKKSYDLPKELPIPRKDDLIFLTDIGLQKEVVAVVNNVSYHLNDLGKLITVCVKCNDASI